MKRVLHILNRMNPGGAESLLMNLYRNIDRNKIQFDFYVTDKGIFDDEILKMGGKIYYTESLQKCGLMKYLKNWKDFLNNHSEYKIIHSHLNNVSGLLFRIAKKKNIPTRIIHSHTSETINSLKVKIFKKLLNHFIIKYSTVLIGCSDKANEWLYGKHKNNAIILNNGIETERFKYDEIIRKRIREDLGIIDTTIVIGHVGRLVEVKNHKFIIEVFERYHSNNNNSILLIIGDGPLKTKIETLVKEKNLENCVKLLGTKTNINEYMQAIDCFIFPSIYEGLPVTLIEAQAAGLPILASKNISEMSKINDNFVFLDINDQPENWVDKINVCDNREKYSDNVRDAGFDIKQTVEKYMKLLENI